MTQRKFRREFKIEAAKAVTERGVSIGGVGLLMHPGYHAGFTKRFPHGICETTSSLDGKKADQAYFNQPMPAAAA